MTEDFAPTDRGVHYKWTRRNVTGYDRKCGVGDAAATKKTEKNCVVDGRGKKAEEGKEEDCEGE